MRRSSVDHPLREDHAIGCVPLQNALILFCPACSLGRLVTSELNTSTILIAI